MHYLIADKPLLDIDDTRDFESQLTPDAFFDEHEEMHGQTVVLQLNQGEYLLRDQWGQKFKESDVLCFQIIPVRDPSSALIFLLNMAVSSFATWAVGYMGLTGMTATLVKAAIVMAGSMLVNALLPQPEPPSTKKIEDQATVYNHRLQLNGATLGAPIPDHYGEGWYTPGWIQQPYYEYYDDNQYIHLLFLIGQGRLSLPQMKFQDTDISLLTSFETEIITPGQQVTLLPAQVFTTDGLATGNLTQTRTIPALSNPPKTVINEIGIDYVFQNGLVRFDDEGNKQNVTVTIEFRYRAVDDAGTPTGSWTLLTQKTVTNNTVDVIRGTIKVPVSAGRYQVDAKRTNDENNDTKVRDGVIWGGLRGYNNTHPDYGNVTLVAVKGQVTDESSRLIGDVLQQFKVFYQRWLPVYNGSTWTTQITRSAIWAFVNAATAHYAGRKPLAALPLDEYKALDDKLITLQHFFDYSITQQIALGEALQHIARCVRTKYYQQGGLLRLWRDEERLIPVLMFNPENTKDFNLDIACKRLDEPDAIAIECIDNVTGLPAEVHYPDSVNRSDEDSYVPVITLTGCSDHNHAFDEAVYLWRARERNESGSFQTGMEGHILKYGDLIAIPSDEYEITTWGAIEYQVGNSLTLSNPHDLTGSGQLVVNDLDGTPVFIDINPGADANTVIADSIPAGLTIRAGHSDTEPSWYIIGTVDHPILLGQVTNIIPGDSDKWMHIEWTGYADIWQPVPVPAQPDSIPLTVENLDIQWISSTETPDGEQYIVTINWNAVADADYYVVGINRGVGGFQRIYNGDVPTTQIRLTPGTVQVRVAAVGTRQGEYYQQDLTIGAQATPLDSPTDLSLVGTFNGANLELRWSLISGAAKYRVQLFDTITLTLRHTVDITGGAYNYSYRQALSDGLDRDITARIYSLDASGNISETYVELAVYNSQMPAPTTGFTITAFLEQISVQIDALPTDSDFGGYLVFASTTQGFAPAPNNLVIDSTGSISTFKADDGATWYLRLAYYDVWGRDDLQFSAEQTIIAGSLDSVTPGDDSITSAMLQDLIVKGQHIQQQALNEGHYSPGSVGVGALSVGSAPNLLANSSFDAGLDHWATYDNSGQASTSNVDISVDWTLEGGHTAWVRHGGQTSSGFTDFRPLNPISGDNKFPVEGGKTYQFSVYLGLHRCRSTIYIGWYDAAGVGIAWPSESSSLHEMPGGKILSNYSRKFLIETAPGNASSAILYIRKWPTEPTGQASSYMFVTQPFFGEALPNQTEPSPYGEGGYTVIKDGSITTEKAHIDFVAARSLIAEDVDVSNLSAIVAHLGEIVAGVARSANDHYRHNYSATGTDYIKWLKNPAGDLVSWEKANGDAGYGGHLHATSFTSDVAVIDTLHVKDRAITDSMFVSAQGSSISGTQLITATYLFKTTKGLILLGYRATGTRFFDADAGSTTYSTVSLNIYKDGILHKTVDCSLADGTTGQSVVALNNDTLGSHTWSATLTSVSDSDGGIGSITDLTLSIFESQK